MKDSHTGSVRLEVYLSGSRLLNRFWYLEGVHKRIPRDDGLRTSRGHLDFASGRLVLQELRWQHLIVRG